METINDRIELLVNERFNGNKAAFAKTIGLPPTALSNYLGSKRRSKPSIDMVNKIIKSIDVDIRWLITGESDEIESKIETHGNYSPASINGNVSVTQTNGVNQSDLVAHLKSLLEEKERTIQVQQQLIDALRKQ